MRIIACMIAGAAVAGCAVAPNGQAQRDKPQTTTHQTEAALAFKSLREIREAYVEQVRLDVEAILEGMSAAHGTQLEASVPTVRRVPE
jgi:hypothetical protein